MLQVISYSFAFHKQPTIQGITLNLAVGEYLSVIGPNGTGKSSLLRCLMQLHSSGSAQGSILLRGRDISRYSPKALARTAAYVPQMGGVIPPLSIAELLQLSRYPHRNTPQNGRRTDAQACARALHLTGLTKLAARALPSLSGGERQKAYIAAALAQDTPLLLLDEPTASLDPHHTAEVANLLRTLHREEGLTIITVTHDVNHPLEMGGKVLALRQGFQIHFGNVNADAYTDLLHATFDHDFARTKHPHTQCWVVLPLGRMPCPNDPKQNGTNECPDPKEDVASNERTAFAQYRCAVSDGQRAYGEQVACGEITDSTPAAICNASGTDTSSGTEPAVSAIPAALQLQAGGMALHDAPTHISSGAEPAASATAAAPAVAAEPTADPASGAEPTTARQGKNPPDPRRAARVWPMPWAALGIALLVLGAVGSPFVGVSAIAPAAVWTPDHPDATVLWRLRLPRALLAFWTGAGLSVCGLAFQTLLRNPLATPYTLGVASGAALGASLSVWLSPLLPAASFFGGMAATGTLYAALAGSVMALLVVLVLTRLRGGFSLPVILLAGVVCSFFFSSIIMYIQYLSPVKDAVRILHWLMGSLTSADTTLLREISVMVILGTVLLWHRAPELDLLYTGDDVAASRGVNVRRTHMTIFVLCSLMVGGLVAVTGPIGFVGMMVPHMCRLWLGFTHERLVPWSFVLGGCFLVICDAISRTALAPAELPTGIVTALLGGPFFLCILYKSTRTHTLY